MSHRWANIEQGRAGRTGVDMVRLLVLTIVCLAEVCHASMRCGNYLVVPGDSKMEVLVRCGPPALAEPIGVASYDRYRRGGIEGHAVPLEAWHYDCGRGLLLKRLIFEGDLLRAVEVGRIRGTGSQRCY